MGSDNKRLAIPHVHQLRGGCIFVVRIGYPFNPRPVLIVLPYVPDPATVLCRLRHPRCILNVLCQMSLGPSVILMFLPQIPLPSFCAFSTGILEIQV